MMEIYGRPRFPFGAAFCGLLTIASLALAYFTQSVHWAVFALAPASLAAGLWFFRPRVFRATLTEQGLVVGNPPELIAFAEIQGMRMGGRMQDPDDPRLKGGPITLVHRRGSLDIPAKLNLPVAKLYQAIFSRLSPRGSGELRPALSGHLQQELDLFGPERVHSFGSRFCLADRFLTRTDCCLLPLLACGVAWCFMPVFLPVRKQHQEFDPTAWIGCGILLTLVSFLVMIALRSRSRHCSPGIRKLRNSEMVISPSGIALVQGDVKGHLRWDELQAVQTPRNTKGFVRGIHEGHGSIHLVVPGATINVLDVYDRPLPLICSVMQRYWRPQQATADE